jgi:hypothetical protein
MAMDNDVSENVSPDAHAFEDDRAAEALNVPALDAVHRLMWLRVSEVPPLVHEDAMEVIALEPADAAAMVAWTRVVEPAAAAVAPADPGSAVWSLTKQVAVAKVPSSQPLTMADAKPTVTGGLLRLA